MNKGHANDADSFDPLADLQRVAAQAMAGITRDPELVRRVRERAEAARNEALTKHGVQNIGVSIIHQIRHGE